MTNEEIARFFNDTQAYIQGNPDLRDPQVEGWFRTRQRFRNSFEHLWDSIKTVVDWRLAINRTFSLQSGHWKPRR